MVLSQPGHDQLKKVEKQKQLESYSEAEHI